MTSPVLPVIVTNEKWVLRSYPAKGQKFDAEQHVELVSEPLLLGNTKDRSNPAAGGGTSSCGIHDIIVKVDTLSVDAFLRSMINDPSSQTGSSPSSSSSSSKPFCGYVSLRSSPIPAIGYGTIIAAGRKSGWSVGSVVIGMLGAQSYAKITTGRGGGRRRVGGGNSSAISSKLTLPWMTSTSSLGLFGLTTGLTAYVGIFCVCSSSRRPRKGETVVVTDATSAVGSIAAQLAKITGARVIGIASNNKKSKSYIMNDLKLDGAIIHNNSNNDDKNKKTLVEDQLESICPCGIDFVFDNVGGEILDTVLNHIRPNARVVICDAVSQYETSTTSGPSNYLKLVEQGAEMKGFTVFQYTRQLPTAVFFLWWYSLRGKVKMTESIHEGIKSFPRALQKTLRHDDGNIGKTLVVL